VSEFLSEWVSACAPFSRCLQTLYYCSQGHLQESRVKKQPTTAAGCQVVEDSRECLVRSGLPAPEAHGKRMRWGRGDRGLL
jgi:hypothetical protein